MQYHLRIKGLWMDWIMTCKLAQINIWTWLGKKSTYRTSSAWKLKVTSKLSYHTLFDNCLTGQITWAYKGNQNNSNSESLAVVYKVSGATGCRSFFNLHGKEKHEIENLRQFYICKMKGLRRRWRWRWKWKWKKRKGRNDSKTSREWMASGIMSKQCITNWERDLETLRSNLLVEGRCVVCWTLVLLWGNLSLQSQEPRRSH